MRSARVGFSIGQGLGFLLLVAVLLLPVAGLVVMVVENPAIAAGLGWMLLVFVGLAVQALRSRS